MEVPNAGFWIALLIGGLVIGSASAIQQYLTKDKNNGEFNIKAIARDFFIGAFLTSVIYMFIPDSIQSLFSSIKESLPTSSEVVEMPEIQTGPAKF